MDKKTTYSCEVCGTVYSETAIQRINNGEVCPLNHQFGYYLKDAQVVFERLEHLEFGVEAVLIDANGISAPRLVVRFDDDYFHDWRSLILPEGFVIIQTRDARHYPLPIEMVYHFDVADISIYKIHEVETKLLDWIKNFPVLTTR